MAVVKSQYDSAAVSNDKVQSMLDDGTIEKSQFKVVYESEVIPARPSDGFTISSGIWPRRFAKRFWVSSRRFPRQFPRRIPTPPIHRTVPRTTHNCTLFRLITRKIFNWSAGSMTASIRGWMPVPNRTKRRPPLPELGSPLWHGRRGLGCRDNLARNVAAAVVQSAGRQPTAPKPADHECESNRPAKSTFPNGTFHSTHCSDLFPPRKMGTLRYLPSWQLSFGTKLAACHADRACPAAACAEIERKYFNSLMLSSFHPRLVIGIDFVYCWVVGRGGFLACPNGNTTKRRRPKWP